MAWLSVFLAFALSALLTSALNWLALGAFRRASAAHWTERARLLWPVRLGAVMCGMSVPLTLAFLGPSVTPVSGAWFLAWVPAGFLGGLLGSFVVHHAAFPARKFYQWLVFMLCLGLFRVVPLLLWVIMGMISLSIGPVRPMVLAIVVLVQLFVSFGLWLWPLRWLGLLQPASPSLETTVRDLAQIMHVRVRHVWETPPVTANAFASPVWGAVVVSRETVAVLSADELRSLLAHELGHLAEPRHVTVRRILGAFWMIPFAAAGQLTTWLGSGGVLLALAACFVWLRLALRLSRSEEHRADAAAALASGSGAVSARALEKLHEAAFIPANLRASGMTHPALYDRMLAAGVTPDYARPEVPSRMALNGWIAILLWFGSAVFAMSGSRAHHENDHNPAPGRVGR